MGRQATPFGRYTSARHKHWSGFCTQLGNHYFAAFAITSSKSRLNFLKVLRAGYGDFVINTEALDYMRQRALADRWSPGWKPIPSIGSPMRRPGTATLSGSGSRREWWS